MKKQIVVLIILFEILTATFGCTEPKQKNRSETNLTKTEVLRIAEEIAKAKGYNIHKYNMTGCHYEYTLKNHTWTVFYELKPPTPPGGHFTVSIDDQTKKATLTRGK